MKNLCIYIFANLFKKCWMVSKFYLSITFIYNFIFYDYCYDNLESWKVLMNIWNILCWVNGSLQWRKKNIFHFQTGKNANKCFLSCMWLYFLLCDYPVDLVNRTRYHVLFFFLFLPADNNTLPTRQRDDTEFRNR